MCGTRRDGVLTRVHIRRLGYALGAEVTGLDLSVPPDADTVAELRNAWLEHIVLCFPEQDLTPEQQSAFCGLFGTLDDNRSRPHRALANCPTVSFNANKPVTLGGQELVRVRADAWHSDSSFTDRPGTANFLLAKELPQAGGDTMFANMYLAYEALSPTLKQIAESLEGIHLVDLSPDFLEMSPERQAQRAAEYPPAVHPVVRVHPETGRKTLYVGEFMQTFAGMTDEESEPLLSVFNRCATSYEVTYRHRWRKHDLVMWDNRASMHYAVPDFDPQESRIMQRCLLHPSRSGRLLQRSSQHASKGGG